jgi:hypothetical protein
MEHWLLFLRSWVQIPPTKWWLTTIRNEIWRLLLVCLKTATVYLHICHRPPQSGMGVPGMRLLETSTWEAEAGEFLSSRPAWSTEWVPGQPGLYRETLSQKNKNKKKRLRLKLIILCAQFPKAHVYLVQSLRASRQSYLNTSLYYMGNYSNYMLYNYYIYILHILYIYIHIYILYPISIHFLASNYFSHTDRMAEGQVKTASCHVLQCLFSN